MKTVMDHLEDDYQAIWRARKNLYNAALNGEPTKDLSIELFNSVSEFERVSKGIINNQEEMK